MDALAEEGWYFFSDDEFLSQNAHLYPPSKNPTSDSRKVSDDKTVAENKAAAIEKNAKAPKKVRQAVAGWHLSELLFSPDALPPIARVREALHAMHNLLSTEGYDLSLIHI